MSKRPIVPRFRSGLFYQAREVIFTIIRNGRKLAQTRLAQDEAAQLAAIIAQSPRYAGK